jgi:hypothetical protein
MPLAEPLISMKSLVNRTGNVFNIEPQTVPFNGIMQGSLSFCNNEALTDKQLWLVPLRGACARRFFASRLLKRCKARRMASKFELTNLCAMYSVPLPCYLLALFAFSAAFSAPSTQPDLSATHKQFPPGYWGADFETSLSIHEWSKVSPNPQLPSAGARVPSCDLLAADISSAGSRGSHSSLRAARAQYGQDQGHCR